MRAWRSLGLAARVAALLTLGLPLVGRAAESPPTILWNMTSVPGNLDQSGVGVGPDGHPIVAGTVCSPEVPVCDIRVVKHDATTGAAIWNVTFGAAVFDEAGGLAIGADGHPVVTGGSCGPNFTDCDFRTVKLDGATGAVLWSVTFDGGGSDEAVAVAVGPDGNPVVSGFSCLPNFTDCVARTIKLSGATGVEIWNVAYGAVGSEGEGVAIGADGHPVVSIFPSQTVKYDGLTGAILWDVAFNGGGDLGVGFGVAVGPDGHAVVAGVECTPDFATCDFRTVKHHGATGARLWSAAFAGGGPLDGGFRVAVGGDGHPVVVGQSCATGAAGCDVRTLKYDGATGGLLWTVLFDGAGNEDFGLGVGIGLDGDPVVVGKRCAPDFVCDVVTVKYLLQHDTLAGAPVVVALNGGSGAAGGVSVTFTTVTATGSTTMTGSATGPPPPAGFSVGSPATYYQLDTTANFSGAVTVCINYSAVSFRDESALKLFHFEDNAWVDRTVSLDTTNNIICGSVTSLSPFAIFERRAITVTIDIKPGSFPNTIKLGESGAIPVAIFSTPTFDARTIDVGSLELNGAAVRIVKGKGFQASIEDVDVDGRLDLVVQFDRGQLDLVAGDTQATVTGRTIDGTLIQGSDSVRIVQ